MKVLSYFTVCLSIALAVCVPANAGLVINTTFDDASFIAAGYSVAAVHNAFNAAVSEYQNLYTDNVTVNITVQAGTTGLGQSNTQLAGYYTYAQVRAALLANYAANPDPTHAAAVADLPATDPTGGGPFAIATAEAKALGLIGASASSDGTFTFSNTASYTFDPLNRQVAGEYDFIGVAEHEISEIMGRIACLGCNFGNNLADYLPNDLFRYTAPGVRSLVPANGVYFSINGGTTNLQGFNGTGGGDLDDYNGSVATDPYNASTGTNQGHMLSAVDQANMEVLGWDVVATPEPKQVILLVFMIGILVVVRRRFCV